MVKVLQASHRAATVLNPEFGENVFGMFSHHVWDYAKSFCNFWVALSLTVPIKNLCFTGSQLKFRQVGY
jgi:hypothetical protein